MSIDGAPDVRYTTKAFDTSVPKPEGHYIAFKFPKKDPQQRQQQLQRPAAGQARLLEPHTIRITSIASTPFSFGGLLVPNTLISQGRSWEEAQALRPVIEFVGEGLDAERPGGFFRTDSYEPPAGHSVEQPAEALFSTVHYMLGERLGVRHTHMAAGTCLLANCDDRKLPGLETQYFFTSPVDHLGRTPNVHEKTDPRHLENLQTPFRFSSGTVPTRTPTHVVVDTGVLDVVVRGLSPDAYAQALARFLVRMRNQAHPKAKILVVAHRGPSPASALLAPAEHSATSTPKPSTTAAAAPSTIAARRNALFAATRDAVDLVGDANTHFAPVRLDGGDPQQAYLRAVCPYMIPSVVDRTKGFFRRQATTRAHTLCADVVRRGAGYGGASGSGAVLFFLLAVLVAGLWVARSTVLGALAAVVGRRRLGMEEDGRLLERERPASAK